MASLGAINASTVLSPQLSFLTSSLAGIISQQSNFSVNLLSAYSLPTLGMTSDEIIGLSDPMSQLAAGYIGGLINIFA